MRLGLSLLWLVMIPTCVSASGWDTNVWGVADTNGLTHGTTNIRYYVDASTNKVFVKDVMRFEVIEAINERNEVVGGAGAFTSGFFRTSRVDLKDAKGWVIAHAVDFVRTNVYESTATFGNSITNEGTYVWDDCSSTTHTNTQDSIDHSFNDRFYTFNLLVSDLGLPSNYFTSTPWRKLSDTNTANGWHHMDDVLNLLDKTKIGVFWSARGETNSLEGLNTAFALFGTNWNDEVAIATTNTTLSSDNLVPPHSWSTGQLFFDGTDSFRCEYFAHFENVYAYPVGTVSTNYNADVTYYTWVDEPRYNAIGTFNARFHPVGTSFFDDLGDVSANVGLWIAHTDIDVSGTYTSATSIGNTSPSDPSPWTDEPTTNTPLLFGPGVNSHDDGHYTALGWNFTVVDGVADYGSASNGFVYADR